MISPDKISFTYDYVVKGSRMYAKVSGQHANVKVTIECKEHFLFPGLGRIRAERKVAKIFSELEILNYAK